MPGNIAAADPGNAVLPQSLCTAFSESRVWPMLVNSAYHDGTIERSIVVDGVNQPSSLRSWKLSKKITAAQHDELLAFYQNRGGGLKAFFFYNPFEPAPGQQPGSNFDITGLSIQGRHTCVFRNPQWSSSTGMPRSIVSIEMAEIA